ncbi:MAG: DUF4038 domain-containing protein [Kiritimatiellae bacterium]|nr:DUF4038 domain-containing protein [Kiritimatiellia bacterium]
MNLSSARRVFSRIALIVAVGSAVAAGPAYGLEGLKVDSSGHFLVTADGRPFVWQGDTLWGMLSLGPADIDFYLDTRKAQGFNVVQMMAHRTDYAGNKPCSQTNPVKLNEAHWSYIDQIVAKAAARDMVICMFLMWGSNADTMFPNPYNNNYQYGRLVGERYATNNNVLFAGSGEYHKIVAPDDGTVFMTPEQVTLIARIGEGLEAGHGGERLNTLHPNAAGAKHSTGSSSQYYQSSPWLDFNMIQTWGHPDHDITVVNADYNKSPAKPTLNGEPGYEDRHLRNYPDAGIMDGWHCRVEAYWALFSGAFGHTYGNSFVYFTSSTWKTHMNSTGADDMRHWRRLLESRPVLIRRPYNAMITSSLGSKLGDATREPGDYRVATRASDGSYAFVYSARGKGFTIDMSRISGSQANAWWYNPRNGTCYDNSGNAVTAPFATYGTSGTRTFNPPGPEGVDLDWVLVLDDASRGFDIPGGGAPPTEPAIAVSTTSISTTCVQGKDAPDATFQVWNGGTGTLAYRVVESTSKFSIAPATGSSTGSVQKRTHTIDFATSGLAVGTYDRSFTVEDNGSGAGNGPVAVAVEITVTPGAPDVPSGITATPLSSSEIRLSWNDVENETQYKLRRSADGTDWYVLPEVMLAADTTSWTDTGLAPHTTRYYKIKAWGEAANSDYTDPVSATTEAAVPVSKGATWSYREGSAEASEPAGAWRRLSFDATRWPTGPAPFGYGDGPYGTVLDIRGRHTCIFLRRLFTVARPAAVSALGLWTLYDDGFVIWINGKEVARHNVAGAPGAASPVDASATTGVPDGTEWTKTLAGAELPVLAATNVLAIQVFNVDLSSSDLTLDAELTATYDPPPGTDADGDGLPDDWEAVYLSDLADPSDQSDSADPDGDGLSNYEEWVAGTDPMATPAEAARDEGGLMVDVERRDGQVLVSFPARPATGAGYTGLTRHYGLQICLDPAGELWSEVAGYVDMTAAMSETVVYVVPGSRNGAQFRAKVWLE